MHTEDAVRAALTVAAEHGIRCAAPVVLRDAANVLVHLAPAPVVARVAAATALVRADVAATLARDVDLTGYLAGRGAPVVPPSAELPPGPHVRADRVLTFWRYVEHVPAHIHRPDEVGPLLAALHAELRGYPGALPTEPPLYAAATLAHLGRPDLAWLAEDADRVLADLAAVAGPAVPLHGDAHPGNLLATPDGPLWTDFEDAWRGPAAWDLACLVHSRRFDGAAAVAATKVATAPGELAACLTARRLQGVLWQLLRAEQVPDRQPEADRGLAEWFAGR